MKLEKELAFAINAATSAGTYLKNVSRAETLSKAGKDIKLREDKVSEELILKILSGTSHKIISEESYSGEKIPEEIPVWIVDPLDGSLNFARGLPDCVVSIGLWKGKSPLVGVVYDFNRDILYCATPDGSFVKGNKISVSNISDKSQGVISTGFPPSMDYSDENLSDMIRSFREFKKTRLWGCPALSLSRVAAGEIEAYHESPINFWDVAAGLALVKFAGGEYQITDLGNGKYDVFASNGKIKN